MIRFARIPKVADKTSFFLAAVFALVSASVVIFPARSSRSSANNPSDARRSVPQSLLPSEPILSARISRIEAGLLPVLIVRGPHPKPSTIYERMAFYHIPGVSVAFFDHGQILWTRTYGFADVGSRKPVTPETLFQAGSVSKPVSALAALHLVQDGQLSLDEDVNIKLKTWKIPYDGSPDKKGKVTVRRILSHSAGISVGSFPGYGSDESVPTLVQILNGQKPTNTEPIRIQIAPGTRWRYSGGGFVILQTLMSDVTGQPFPQIVRELVLEPGGMSRSTFDQPLPKDRVSQAATPYHANGEPLKGGPHIYPEMAAAGLWTTPSDLARMAIEVQNEYAGKSSKILEQYMVKEMLSDQIGGWGLGFALEDRGYPAHFFHGGGTAGYACYLDTYTRLGQGFAVMTNSDGSAKFIQEIFRSVAKEYGWPDHHPAEIFGVALGGIAFVAVPCLVALACWTWSQGLRGQLPKWRSFLGLGSIVVIFVNWFGLAVLALSVLMSLDTGDFSPDWMHRIAFLTVAGTLLAFALRGTARIEAILAGVFMVAAWVTSLASYRS